MSFIQYLIDGVSAAEQARRGRTQMTLGKLIETLEGLQPSLGITGLGHPMSYRGYYNDLAFAPSAEVVTVGALLATCRACMGKVFTGYKGGEYVMGALTPVHVAEYGSCGRALIGLDIRVSPIMPVCREEEDD